MIAADASHGSWSPNGTGVAFIKGGRTREDPGYAGQPLPEGLWIVQPDGTNNFEVAKRAWDFDWQSSHS
jgi:hypothetical protein